jgi:hypothetical protein
LTVFTIVALALALPLVALPAAVLADTVALPVVAVESRVFVAVTVVVDVTAVDESGVGVDAGVDIGVGEGVVSVVTGGVTTAAVGCTVLVVSAELSGDSVVSVAGLSVVVAGGFVGTLSSAWAAMFSG